MLLAHVLPPPTGAAKHAFHFHAYNGCCWRRHGCLARYVVHAGGVQQLDLLAQLVAQLAAALPELPAAHAGDLAQRAGDLSQQVAALRRALVSAQEEGKAGR